MGFLGALTVGAGALTAYGQVKQGQQAAQAEQYNAAVYNQQSDLIKQAAASNKEADLRAKASAVSTMRANYAFRGVKLSGSPLLVLADTAANLEKDVQNREYEMLVGATRAQSQARMSEMAARNYKMAGYIGAGGTVLSTAIAARNFMPAKLPGTV